MNKIIKRVGTKLSSIFNFLLLSIIYFLGIGVTSIFAKIFGKSFLSIKKNGQTKTGFLEFKKSNNLEKMF